MQAIWSGAISFGLIHIPVQLYSAVNERGLEFNYLRKKDLCPIKYRRTCQGSDEEVPYKDIVKGYEVKKGQYVVLEDEDFKRASVKRSQLIEILSFVDASEVDPKLFEKPYYLEPEKDASKAYAILREALKRSQKVGVARFVLKSREHLAILKAETDAIILNQIRFCSEIRDPADLRLPKEKEATAKELEIAEKLILQLSEPFNLEQYQDTYSKELLKYIEAKAKGKQIHVISKEPTPTAAADLMAKLRQSLEEVKRKGAHQKGNGRKGISPAGSPN